MKTAKDTSWSLSLFQLSQGNAKNVPLSPEPFILWERNAHGRRCPWHTDCKSALRCGAQKQLCDFCEEHQLKQSPYHQNQSWYWAYLISFRNWRRETKPNPVCVFRCHFCFAEVWVVHWKACDFWALHLGFVKAPGCGVRALLWEYLLSFLLVLKSNFQSLCLHGGKKKAHNSLEAWILKRKCQIKPFIYNLIISKTATLFWKVCVWDQC